MALMEEDISDTFLEQSKALDNWLKTPFKSRFLDLLRARIVDVILIEQQKKVGIR